ncbi:MAG: outer membrane protein assembly factor BamA [Gemmobacter sp.]
MPRDTGQDMPRKGRTRAGVILVVLGMALFGWLADAGAAVAQQFRFGSVVVEGNDRIEARTIVALAAIPRASAVSAADLNDATQRIVGSGLFEDVALTPRGGTLVIAVRERPTLNVVSIEGNRLIQTDQLRPLLQSQSRRVFNPALAEADAARLAEAYGARGRLAARVTPRVIPREGNRVDLVFEIAEGRVTEVERLSFVGNRAFSDRRLRQVLETRQAGLLRAILTTDTFAADRIETDKRLLRDFYLSRGYIDFQVADASVELLPERDGFFVTFTVREGQRYRFGALTVVSEVPEADVALFQPLLRIRSGTVYTPTDVENTIARMETFAERSGINFLRVDPRVRRNPATGTLDITFALVRGPRVFVERIDIEGNATTLDQVIRRQFRSVEGDPFNPREIRAAAERIRALGFFARADVDTRPGSAADRVIVKTEVEEQPTGSLSFGASYGVAEGFGVVVALSEQNFLGRGQSLRLNLALGQDDTGSSFSFAEPAFLGRDLRLGFDVSYDVTRANFARFDTRNFTLSPSLEFPVSERGRLRLRYTLTNAAVFNVNVADSSPILLREAAQGQPADSSVGYTYTWDNRRGGLAQRDILAFELSQDISGIGGGLQYLRTTAKAIGQTRVLNDEVSLRAELEGGFINTFGNTVTRVTERFTLAGKMRGFEPFGAGPRDLTATNQDPLGGNAFAVARVEVGFPLGLPVEYGLTGGVFADIGSVWSLNDTNGGLVDDSLRLRSAVGVSLFWATPIGPLRFNFSKAIIKEPYDREQTFDLTISTRF